MLLRFPVEFGTPEVLDSQRTQKSLHILLHITYIINISIYHKINL